VTLVELIVSMAIMLIALGVVFPKDYEEKYLINSFAKQLISDIRYVRSCNMNGNSAYILLLNEDKKYGYGLREDGKYLKTIYLPEGIRLVDNISTSKINFSINGSPSKGRTITIKSNTLYKEITITPSSGRVLLKEGQYE
jgi:hypothetical protein